MDIFNKKPNIIRLACFFIVNFLFFHVDAQEKLPTFTLNGEEFEVMPSDEKGSPTWWEATERCANKQAYGHSDWFIPDIDQLRALYAHQNAIGGFTDNWYWSSTQNNQYSSAVINFKSGQSFPEGNNSRAVKCRYIRKTGRTHKTQDDYQWIYGEWVGKYSHYFQYVWKDDYMVVTITPKQLVITDKGTEMYKGGYVVKDNLIEYIPYHNNTGWIGSDVWGFLEIMPESHQLGSGFKRVLDKTNGYSAQKKVEIPSNANIVIKSDGCAIFIDGEFVGNNRWIGSLKSGRHTVKVTADYYDPYEQKIDVVGGKDETFTITPLHLKKRNINVSCNVDNALAIIDGTERIFDPNKTLLLNLELKKTHTLTISAPKRVPITLTFSIMGDTFICEKQEGLSSYNGKQSDLVKFDSGEIGVCLNKLNNRLYYGNDPKYMYSGPVMGVDKIMVTGASIGSEIACYREYYNASRLMYCGSLGLALMPGNEDASFVLNEMPVEYYIGLGLGYQLFEGTSFRVTPQIGAIGYSLFDDPYIVLCAKVSVSYPINEKYVVGVSPMVSFLTIEELENPYVVGNVRFGMSLTLGWQNRK